MQLCSARDLKAELIAELRPPVTSVITERTDLHLDRCNAPRTAPLTTAKTWSELPGAPALRRVTVAIGICRRGNEFNLALRVADPAIFRSALLERIVRRTVGEVEIRPVGRIRSLAHSTHPPSNRTRLRPLVIGASTGHVDVPVGSIGAFARDGNTLCLLSNSHVLANENRGQIGDSVIQPGLSDGGRDPQDRVGTLHRFVPLSWTEPNYVDAALAELSRDVEYDPVKLRGIPDQAEGRLTGTGALRRQDGEKLYKVGRSTGATSGRVTAFELSNLVVGYEQGDAIFDEQIEIESIGGGAFAEGGDSGATAVNAAGEAVALIFAGEAAGSGVFGLTYASPIHRVLSELDASLVT